MKSPSPGYAPVGRKLPVREFADDFVGPLGPATWRYWLTARQCRPWLYDAEECEMSVDVATAGYDTQVSTLAQRFDGKENIFTSFFERSGLCVAHFDHASRVIEANGDFCRQFGRSPREVHGRVFSELLHPSVRERITQQ